MNVSAIRKRLSKAGPFIVRTSDGEHYTVLQPEFIEDEQVGIDLIDPLHVAAIRRAPSTMAKNGN
jgi:hypothetical protein